MFTAPTTKRQLAKVERRLLNQFPALVSLAPDQFLEEITDSHSLVYGETCRWIMLLRALAEGIRVVRQQKYDAKTARDFLLRRLHAYYFGGLRERNARKSAPMYRGRPSDFDVDLRRWEAGCSDVEKTWRYLLSYLPKTLVLADGRTITLAETLKRPAAIQDDDPLELIRLAGSPDLRTKHLARTKLVTAMFCMEERRHGFDPGVLDAEAREIEVFLRDELFVEPEGDRVWIVADLDPAQHFACVRFRVVTDPTEVLPDPSPTVFVGRFERLHIEVPGRADPVPVFFFIRSKKHISLKAMIKDQRYLELLDLGDAIAMKFVMDRDELDAVTPLIRQRLVACPGQVCNQDSRIGYRLGQGPLDQKNPYSSSQYEAQKYNALVCDRVIEVQFVPIIAEVNARCMDTTVNHALYKLGRHLELFQALLPKRIFGIDWTASTIVEQCRTHVLRHTPD